MYRALVILLSLSFFSFEKEGDELRAIDQMIALSEKQLHVQKELKSLLQEFKAQQEVFQEDQSKEHATKMVQTALHILKIVRENNYEHLFSPVFMHELQLFSSIAAKRTPGKP